QARDIATAHASMQAGRWERSSFNGIELNGKILGVIGFGRIGKLVASRAQAFGMQVIAYDPYIAPESGARIGVEIVDLGELFARADIITVHLPKTKETAGLINAETIATMKDG